MFMQLRQCGKSDLKLSALGLGCWSFGGGDYWGPHKQEDADAVVRLAVELGCNYFDTAEMYNNKVRHGGPDENQTQGNTAVA